MKRKLLLMTLLVAMAAGLHAAPSDTNAPPCRLALELVDGSRLIGSPRQPSVCVQAPYARVNLPWNLVANAWMQDDCGTGTFNLVNGDRLTGATSLAPLELETMIGRLSIRIALIRSLSLQHVLSLPASLHSRMIAFYAWRGNAADVSGNERHGMIQGAVLTADRQGNADRAYVFNGTGAHIDCGSMEVSLPVSVSLWVKSEAVNRIWKTALGWNQEDGLHNGVQVCANGDGAFRVRIGQEGDDVLTQSRIDGDGKWHLLVATRDAENRVRLFVDGKLEAEASASGEIGKRHNLYLGRSMRPENYGEFFAGTIGEVGIYNGALSEVEIRELWALPK